MDTAVIVHTLNAFNSSSIECVLVVKHYCETLFIPWSKSQSSEFWSDFLRTRTSYRLHAIRDVGRGTERLSQSHLITTWTTVRDFSFRTGHTGRERRRRLPYHPDGPPMFCTENRRRRRTPFSTSPFSRLSSFSFLVCRQRACGPSTEHTR